MDNTLRKYYKEYGKYVNRWRALPHLFDGLKPVERRILIAAWDVARDKFVKSRTVNAHTIGYYHPHGDVSSTLALMVNNGFLDGQGDFGSSIGLISSPPAADRYTECKLSSLVKKMAFELINYVPSINEDWMDEPLFLPTLLPFCLINKTYSSGIAFGYRSFIPCYEMDDLYQRLLFLLGKLKEEPIIKPITDCEVLSYNDDLKELLTKGKAKIKVKGIVEYNNIKQEAVIKSWPCSKTGIKIIQKIETKLPDVKYTDLSSDLYNGTYILFEVTKQRGRDETFKKLKAILEEEMVGDISFEIVLVDENGKPKVVGVDEMLLTTFNLYKQVSERYLKFEKNKLEEAKSNYMLLEKIRPDLGLFLKENEVVENVIEIIVEKHNCDKNQVTKLLKDNSIFKLLKLKLDIEKLDIELNDVNDKIKNPQKFVLSKYKDIIK